MEEKKPMEEKKIDERKIMFSGIQPSGDLTLGSYMGAIKNWVDMIDDYRAYYCIVDMHAITVRQVPADLRRRTMEQLAQYIACGLDPDKVTLFVQSHNPCHAELGWVLNCYTMFGELSRALMAADILLYQADFVPVGDDQKQHVELTRDVAIRFNNVYGETFKVPQAYIPRVGARIMSLQDPTSKMSKSDKDPNGCVHLLEKPEDVMRKFKRAVTDSDTGENCVRFDPANKPGVANLMQIYASATGESFEEIERDFTGKGYGAFKTAVGEAVVELLRPIQAETQRILKDKAYLQSVYRQGAEKAYHDAWRTLRKVYKKLGFVER